MSDLETVEDVLGLPTAGAKAIRGTAIRTAGSATGLLLLAVASVFLVRHLGVHDFGRYATVMAVVGVGDAITNAGLNLVGQRELVHAQPGDKRRLIGNLLGIRLLFTPLGVVAGVLFALAAGYGRTMVLGVLIAGCAAVVASGRRTLMIPLQAELRLGVLASVDLVKDAVIAGGIVILAVAGASLLPFFGVHLVAAAASLAVLASFVGRAGAPPAHFSWQEWKPIVAQAVPLGLAAAIGILYLRALLVMSSLVTNAYETGLFATSTRMIEIVAITGMLTGPAFPILAHAAQRDEQRLQYVLQRMFHVMTLLSVGLLLLLSIGGEPIVRLLGGDEFREAGPVLQIQSFALVGTFTSSVWAGALIAIRRQQALILTNSLAFVLILVLGTTLIPAFGAKGAAAAAIAGETLLSVGEFLMLRRARPSVRINLRFVPRVAVAAGAGALCLLIPGLSALATAGVAVAVYAVAAVALRAIPVELFEAFGLRKARR